MLDDGDRAFIMTLSPGDVAKYGQGRYQWRSKAKHNNAKLEYNLPDFDFPPGKKVKRGKPDRIPQWEQLLDSGLMYKQQIMLEALREKFKFPYFQNILLETGDKWIIEHVHIDKQWADGSDGTGLNYLGKLLMHVRKEINSGTELPVDLELLSIPMNEIIPEYYEY
eukprot:TRINITY_DN637_c0_g1_i2.p1 TRINITY_DN637_c0_g1~~TRINITY_DN637_c0_g1_i2.p1  ORF type:complete len:166 (-),score=37.97 TRINITY_DN637_c0_g1_i2:193-690(-)